MADKDKIPVMAMPVATAVYRSQQTKGIILCADMDERAMVIERSEAMGVKLKPKPLLYEELRHNHLMAAPELIVINQPAATKFFESNTIAPHLKGKGKGKNNG